MFLKIFSIILQFCAHCFDHVKRSKLMINSSCILKKVMSIKSISLRQLDDHLYSCSIWSFEVAVCHKWIEVGERYRFLGTTAIDWITSHTIHDIQVLFYSTGCSRGHWEHSNCGNSNSGRKTAFTLLQFNCCTVWVSGNIWTMCNNIFSNFLLF